MVLLQTICVSKLFCWGSHAKTALILAVSWHLPCGVPFGARPNVGEAYSDDHFFIDFMITETIEKRREQEKKEGEKQATAV